MRTARLNDREGEDRTRILQLCERAISFFPPFTSPYPSLLPRFLLHRPFTTRLSIDLLFNRERRRAETGPVAARRSIVHDRDFEIDRKRG